MSRGFDPERLVLEDLTDQERDALLEQTDPADAARAQALASALSALDADAWRESDVPALRFVPEGAGKTVPLWSRVCVRGDDGGHRVTAPLVAFALVAVLLVGIASGFALRGTTDGGTSAADRAEARLDAAPAVSLMRIAGAPRAASGIARVVSGSGGQVMVRVHGLQPTGDSRWYELWMMRDAHRMKSMGTFRVRADGTAVVRFRLGIDPAQYPTIDVSVQSAADGSAHSGQSVLRSAPST